MTIEYIESLLASGPLLGIALCIAAVVVGKMSFIACYLRY